MKIIIAGAGEVGSHLARLLGNDYHNITVIDPDENRLKMVSQVSDLITIEGPPTSVSILHKARINKADLFIAVNPSESQDMNITCALLAKKLGAKKVVARINNDEYLMPENKNLFEEMGIDYLLYPEKIAAKEIINLLARTGTTEYVDFSGGKLQLIVIRLDENAPVIGSTLEEVKAASKSDTQKYSVLAIDRQGEIFIPEAEEEFKVNDMIYIISTRDATSQILKYAGKTNIDVNNLMILGGSPIGIMVAKELEDKINVKMVDTNREKCIALADELKETLVINADGRNTDIMQEEELRNMDAFIAVTQNSETNILACMAAKKAGAKKTIAEIENIDYIKLAESIGVDTVINKKIIAAGRIFRLTMDSEVQAVNYLNGADAEVFEFIAKPNCPATATKVRNLNLPEGAIIAGLIRGENAYMITPETEIKAYDRVVVFTIGASSSKIGNFFS